MIRACNLHITGIVQGVGFRPFVYRTAREFELTGWVLNSGDGVHVHVEAAEEDAEERVNAFIDSLKTNAPTAARIDSVEVTLVEGCGFIDFTIRRSDDESDVSTLISPDIATCPECLRELFDENDRRYHYPFINCTNCGPRFTIIDALPYDRKNTSMTGFVMCDDCNREYRDPTDRRFHAQPDACFECGPQLSLWRPGFEQSKARSRIQSDRLIAEVAELLTLGRIVALKGLGGYHLACDATNERAVAELRKRKRRTAKPLAIMVASVDEAKVLCRVNSREEELLTGSVRPIVLLQRRRQSEGSSGIAPSVAGNLHELGVMLPYTPLQHLLFAELDVPLVMTSGNISEEPIIAKESEAHELLRGIADAFLDNDREILSRYDDSVVRVIDDRVYMVRRARGYAPVPIDFPRPDTQAKIVDSDSPVILATGPEQKSTFCLAREGAAFVSQHLGDLENSQSFNSWQSTLTLYKRLFDLTYDCIAFDMHPEYLTGKWARAQDEARIEVQHHHAHIAAILAEHRACGSGGRRRGDRAGGGDIGLVEQVIGIAFDGTGYGDDATIWGGEVLMAGPTSAQRFAHLEQVVLPGGVAAIEYPNRMAWSYLKSAGLTEHPGAAGLKASLERDRLLLLDKIIDKRLNSPLTSSMGRLFDAVSALLGICTKSNYEGQAAIELEAALHDEAGTESEIDDTDGDIPAEPTPYATKQRYRFTISGDPILPVFEPGSVLRAILEDLQAKLAPALISRRFHDAVVELIVELAELARTRTGVSTVALGGGVFMNRYLLTQAIAQLDAEGFTVLTNRELPANDGCISYGQAAVAAAQWTALARQGIMLGT